MSIIARHWVPSGAVRVQENGPEYLGMVDEAQWSQGQGFYRGFFTAFALRAGKDVWFHFPLPTMVEFQGKPLWAHSVSLLWETLDGAAIHWTTLQHGGAQRIELTARMQPPASQAVPFEIAPEHRKYYPAMDRRLSEFVLTPRLALQFGAQLCVMVSAGAQDSVVRFYGAGIALADAPS